VPDRPNIAAAPTSKHHRTRSVSPCFIRISHELSFRNLTRFPVAAKVAFAYS